MRDKLSVFCPYCQQQTSLEPSLIKVERQSSAIRIAAEVPGRDSTRAITTTCNYCNRFVFIVEDYYGHKEVFPNPLPSATDKRIKEPANTALVEAKRCFGANAPNACATMARRAIQAAVIERGATPKKHLIDQIDEMKSKGVITPELATWAHEVRFIGNDGAHPADDVSDEEAEDALKLAEEFLSLLYVTPAIAEERRAKRLAAKAKS